MYYYLYWDESDENNPNYQKLARSVYSSYEEALAQANHDIQCLRCRMDENGAFSLIAEPSGKNPHNLSENCPDCDGTKISPSRNILCIEESEKELGGAHRNSLERGIIVWEYEQEGI